MVLVVGYGNPLRSDDVVGRAVAERVATDPRFAGAVVRAEHQLTPELAMDVRDAAVVVLVDADAERPAGAVEARAVDEPADAISAWSHHLDPAGLAGLARELWGAAPPVYVVSVGVESLDVGDRLTPVVEAAVPRAVDTVAALVEGHARA